VLYAVHGALDNLIPPTQVDRLRQALGKHGDVEFDVPADGDHCCYNLYHLVRAWLAERLGGCA
jgi:dienelactone hydrolase